MTTPCPPMLLSSRPFQPVPALPRPFRDAHFTAFLVRRSPPRRARSSSWLRVARLLSALGLLFVAVVFGLRPVA